MSGFDRRMRRRRAEHRLGSRLGRGPFKVFFVVVEMKAEGAGSAVRVGCLGTCEVETERDGKLWAEGVRAAWRQTPGDGLAVLHVFPVSDAPSVEDVVRQVADSMGEHFGLEDAAKRGWEWHKLGEAW